jgi:hypothetical protein
MATRTVVAPDAELALDLVRDAQLALGHDNVGPDRDTDARYGLLCQMEFQWAATDRRWDAAKILLSHEERGDSACCTEALGLLVRIVDLVDDFTVEGYPDPKTIPDSIATARELRDATDRLCEIVRAITAMPLLGEGR